MKDIAKQHKLSIHQLYRISRIWAGLGIAQINDKRKYKDDRPNYYIKPLLPILPDILYSWDRFNYENQPENWNNIESNHTHSKENRKNIYGMSKAERNQRLKECKK
jgi:hypothetical protein